MLNQKIIIILFITVLSFATWASDISLPKFEQVLDGYGIGQYNNNSYHNLIAYFENKIEDENEKKSAKKFYKYAVGILKETNSENEDSSKRIENFVKAKRLAYSIEAESTPFPTPNLFKLLFNAILRFDLTIPYVDKKERKLPIGIEKAKLEAANLVSPNEEDHFLTPDELQELSVNQIADLDISSNHYAWKTEKARLSSPDAWGDLEKWTTKKIKKDLEEKLGKDAAKEYSLDNAKKVVFINEIKTTATSPKVNVNDAYGNPWKLKWGNEVQIEAVNNRLYVKLGSKFTDLVYTNKSGIDGLVLVLGDPTESGSCENINSYELLRECLLDSKYKFNIDPYVLSKGKINKENMSVVLKNFPQHGKYKMKDMEGRTYITFHESMVEFKHKDIMEYGGAIAQSTVGATEDRVARGLVVFNMWIGNIDAKDDNAKSVLMKDYLVSDKDYLEYQHDLGSSMGGIGQTGRVNKMKDSSFVNASKLFKTVEFDQWVLYRPKAWEKASFADALWMAKKLATITKKDLEEVFSYTWWPDFFQKTFVRKMQVRRNAILKEFNLRHLIPDGESEVADVNEVISLMTPGERKFASNKYGVDLIKLENELRRVGKLKSNGISAYQDKIVKNNMISSCKRSIIINLLEQSLNPSGLERRVKRNSDDKPLPVCEFDPDGLKDLPEGK